MRSKTAQSSTADSTSYMREFLGVELGKVLLLQLSHSIFSNREKAHSDYKDERLKIKIYGIYWEFIYLYIKN